MKVMIKEGVLDGKIGPAVDEIYGIHIWSFYNLGVIACQVIICVNMRIIMNGVICNYVRMDLSWQPLIDSI